MTEYYKGWPLLQDLPRGWVIDDTAGSPLHGYKFCTNNKSILNGQKRALVKVLKPQIAINFEAEKKPTLPPQSIKKPIEAIDPNTPKTVNQLARAKFKAKLLNDILVDLTICELEGWDKMEYIQELQALITNIGKKGDLL